MEPIFFPDPGALRAWFAEHAETCTELHLGYWKKGTGLPSVTWPESVDEALCVGWIDGVRRRLDDDSYVIRFTPRRRGSTWSTVNIDRVGHLTAQGRMRPAGVAAFAARRADRSGTYSFEQASDPVLEPGDEALLRADPEAWAFFQAQPAGYRRTATWWVVSAKRPETRRRRLDVLIADSRAGRRIGPLRR